MYSSLSRGLMFLVICVLSQADATAAPLYDGSLGTTPDAQGWTYTPAPNVDVGMSATPGGTLLQTLSSINESAGFYRTVPDLNRTTGYTLSFNVQINGESHVSSHRSGFSVIALSNDKKGIELSFWTNEIFAKESDVPTFSHAEGITTNTTTINEYFLTIQGNGYTLTGASLSSPLIGSLRDYSLHPIYNQADFLFLGDNTTSAGANIFLGNITLQAIPEPGTWALGGLLLLGFGVVTMRRSNINA